MINKKIAMTSAAPGGLMTELRDNAPAEDGEPWHKVPLSKATARKATAEKIAVSAEAATTAGAAVLGNTAPASGSMAAYALKATSGGQPLLSLQEDMHQANLKDFRAQAERLAMNFNAEHKYGQWAMILGEAAKVKDAGGFLNEGLVLLAGDFLIKVMGLESHAVIRRAKLVTPTSNNPRRGGSNKQMYFLQLVPRSFAMDLKKVDAMKKFPQEALELIEGCLLKVIPANSNLMLYPGAAMIPCLGTLEITFPSMNNPDNKLGVLLAPMQADWCESKDNTIVMRLYMCKFYAWVDE